MIPPVLTDISQSCSLVFPGTVEEGSGREEQGTAGWGLRVGSVPVPDPLFPHSQIIRVQSPEGVKRITATKRETVGTFLKKVPQGAQCLPGDGAGLPCLCPVADPCLTPLAAAFHVENHTLTGVPCVVPEGK